MVNTSKILTVSYGTFSCTLEGFDDSFEMMKAIAEYFRDLAQDDRYFGAEPPTPDAQMLAQIAEREMSRRVEARQERGSIVLRPSAEPEAVAAPAAPVEAPLPPVQAAQPATPPQEEMAAPDEPVEEIAIDEDAEFEEELAELEAELADDVVQEAPAPATSPDEEDSIAAKLSRIRAVVSRAPENQAEPAYSEDEHAQDASDDTAASIAAALREPDMPLPELDEEEGEDDLTGFADDYFEDEEEDEPVEDPQLAEDIAQASADPAPAADTPARARVIRMKRTDFEAALAEGQLEEDEDDEGLSPEAEADLMQELAEVEAELKLAHDEDEDEDEDIASIFAEDEEEEAPAAPRPAASGKAETDVGRLMDKAEQEMDSPDGAHRRSAIAHLRAAVQATRAESEAGSGLNRSDDSVSAYRDDLNRVVRPRRPRPAPDAEAEAPRRPTSKPAPLKLVAEQRIDAPAPAQAQPVRPRRVSVADIQDDDAGESVANASSFVEFAEKAGVKDLSELMEAAAAYMSYVEGRQKFSRPQLMNKARLVEEYAFSREDGLRSFGQLLRQGKIEKLKGGRFTVSDELIGFKPDGARAAG